MYIIIYSCILCITDDESPIKKCLGLPVSDVEEGKLPDSDATTVPLSPEDDDPASSPLSPQPILSPEAPPLSSEDPPISSEAPPISSEAPTQLPEAPPLSPEAPPLSPEAPPLSPSSSVPLTKSVSDESVTNEPLTEGLPSPEGCKGSSGDSEDEGRYSMDKSE